MLLGGLGMCEIMTQQDCLYKIVYMRKLWRTRGRRGGKEKEQMREGEKGSHL